MISKIRRVHDFGVFHDFDWDSTVRDKGNNIGEFKKLNILYGRNYSGKTTLSRILRCFKKGVLHEKYPNAKFEIIHTGNVLLDQKRLSDHLLHIRIYNKDFVRENLQWLIDDQGHIEPFAIIGEENIEIENKIKENEKLLGNEEDKKGLRYEVRFKSDEYAIKRTEKNKLQDILDGKLRDKANNEIKRNTIYNDVTYNINDIKNDIQYLSENPISLLEEDQIISLKELLKEEPKLKIYSLAKYSPTFKTIYENSTDLLTRRIKPSVPIQQLLNDAVLELWVRSGIEHHRGKRETCGFCGQKLPYDLWNKLDAHFNKESEALREAIVSQIASIEQEKQNINNFILFKEDQFYSTLKKYFIKKQKEWNDEIKKYCSNLDKILVELNARIKDIFKSRILNEINDSSYILNKLQEEIDGIASNNNLKTDTLTKDQSDARTYLRLNEVGEFVKAIDYNDNIIKIKKLAEEERQLYELKNIIYERIKNVETEIDNLRIQLKDEKKGAEKVNEYLSHYFGHEGLKLVAQEEGGGYRFNIQRREEIAHNLSEGERSLVAFCYFMARLEDTESEGKELIIWIDDPVSSLDSNHIFFVFSLIENIITKTHKYKQLFISTHNLEFLKYLRKLTQIKKETEYFLVEGGKSNSKLIIMPEYLKDYITEFNYLFHQIYKCATVTTMAAEHDCFYNFGNNLRKFLDAYLFYKYPVQKTIYEKIKAFFGDDEVSSDLTFRLENEFSHLERIFDRSMKPIDIPEIPKVAKYVLDKIKEKDNEQYNALLESIGIGITI